MSWVIRSGDVPLARSSSIRRLTNISKSDMSITSFIRREGNVALNKPRGKLQFFHVFWLSGLCRLLLGENLLVEFRTKFTPIAILLWPIGGHEKRCFSLPCFKRGLVSSKQKKGGNSSGNLTLKGLRHFAA